MFYILCNIHLGTDCCWSLVFDHHIVVWCQFHHTKIFITTRTQTLNKLKISATCKHFWNLQTNICEILWQKINRSSEPQSNIPLKRTPSYLKLIRRYADWSDSRIASVVFVQMWKYCCNTTAEISSPEWMSRNEQQSEQRSNLWVQLCQLDPVNSNRHKQINNWSTKWKYNLTLFDSFLNKMSLLCRPFQMRFVS